MTILVAFIYRYVLLLLVGVVVGYFISDSVSDSRDRAFTYATEKAVAEQLTTIASLSEVMARGGADAITEAVITDCPAEERAEFDELLGKLNIGLPRGELLELSRLFDRCAAFYARQKAVMAARFEREVEWYDDLVALRSSLDERSDVSVETGTVWQSIAKIEQEQAVHMNSLVSLQGEIIETLLSGKSAGAPEITALLEQVREVQEMQSYNALLVREQRSLLPTTL